jgi:hypothetical protein
VTNPCFLILDALIFRTTCEDLKKKQTKKAAIAKNSQIDQISLKMQFFRSEFSNNL